MQSLQTFFGKQKVDLIGVYCVKVEYFDLALILASLLELVISVVLSLIEYHFFSSIVFSVITLIVGLIGFIFSMKRRIKATPVFIICFILVAIAMTIAYVYEIYDCSRNGISKASVVLMVVVALVWVLKYVFTVMICVYSIKLFKFASKKERVAATVDVSEYSTEDVEGYVPPHQISATNEGEEQNIADDSGKDSAIII